MGTLEALLYGLIQGTTEFLPVSSSGHLALLPKTLGFKDPGVLFDLAMHIGTAFAIALYFRKDIKSLSSSTLRLILHRKIQSSSDALCANMIIATIITGILGLLLKEWAFTYGRNPSFIAFNLVFFGLLMAWADSFFDSKDQELMKEFSPVRSSLIGLFQVLAIFPGVSRSGATLTISRFLKLSRYEAGRFSFLLSLPLIVAGSIYEFTQLNLNLINFELSNLLFGIAVSFFIGILTIHYFLKWISKIGLWPFSLYRLFLGIIVYWFLT